jgi:GNAT superfamily N-acetyltransferase
MDVDGEMPELHALATYYHGVLWVAERDGVIAGMIAARPDTQASWEICRVYVDPSLHGSGLGHALLDQAERHAIQQGAERLFLFTDTRFARAHRFYEKRSYVRSGPVRVLRDLSASLEFAYAKPVNGTAELDIAAAESASARLAELLVTCVEEGATVSFLPPISFDRARAFWRQAARDVGAGRRRIIAGWKDGTLAGCGILHLDLAENQPHVAEAQKILVHPSARRTGMGRWIMASLEQAARAAGRTMIILDTRAGDGGEALYRASGWQEYGRLDGHAIDAARQPITTVFLFKALT